MKIKRVVAAMLFVCLLINCIPPVQTNAATTEGDYTYEIVDGTATITGYTGAGGDVVIPSTLGGYPVTVIGESVFYDRDDLSSVVIPEGVTAVAYRAFAFCDELSAVTFPETLTAINDNAFRDCYKLTSVTIPDSVTSIGDGAFFWCTSLTTVEIPASVTSIGHMAFSVCSSLTGIWVNENNPNYSNDMRGVLFNKDKTQLIQAPAVLTGNYEIPDGVAFISGSAFDDCNSLTSVCIPASVSTIGYAAIAGCGTMTQILVDADNPYYCNDDRGVLFDKNKTKLIQAPGGIFGGYDIPAGVQEISNAAFHECNKLTAVTIQEGVSQIGEGAFFACEALSAIAIPDSVTTIGDAAFQRCEALRTVQLGSGITKLERYLFSMCYDLKSVNIPSAVTVIEEGAFSNCRTLRSVNIPAGVTTIEYRAFEDCSFLSKVIYCGTEEQWKAIGVSDANGPLQTAVLKYHDYQNGACVFCGAVGFNPDPDPEPSEQDKILDDAVALAPGEVLDYAATLTGTVTAIVNPYDAKYSNITVNMNVSGTIMQCYRLKSGQEDCSKIAVGDTITVFGIIQNYNGMLEFSANSVLDARVSGGGTAKPESWNAEDSLADAAALAPGEKLSYFSNLTGRVTSIDVAYDASMGSICLHIDVNGSSLYCYRLRNGNADVSQIEVGDTITVRGILENYRGNIEFGNGTTLTSLEKKDCDHQWIDATCIALKTCTLCGKTEGDVLGHDYQNGTCTGCSQVLADAIELSGDGKISAFDAQILAEAQAGLRTLTDEQWQALGALKVSDIIDYILGRFPGMKTEE